MQYKNEALHYCFSTIELGKVRLSVLSEAAYCAEEFIVQKSAAAAVMLNDDNIGVVKFKQRPEFIFAFFF